MLGAITAACLLTEAQQLLRDEGSSAAESDVFGVLEIRVAVRSEPLPPLEPLVRKALTTLAELAR